MRFNTMQPRRVAAAAGAASALVLATPVVALAEGEGSSSGIQLLMPNMTEFIPAVIAFIVLWLVLGKFAWPTVTQMMDEREKAIQKSLDEAEHANERAEEAERACAVRMETAEREAAELLAQARRDAEEERSEILARAQKDAAATIAKGREAIESERRRAANDLSKSVVDLAVEIAGKIIGNDLTDDEHRRLAEKYLEEVGRIDGD